MDIIAELDVIDHEMSASMMRAPLVDVAKSGILKKEREEGEEKKEKEKNINNSNNNNDNNNNDDNINTKKGRPKRSSRKKEDYVEKDNHDIETSITINDTYKRKRSPKHQKKSAVSPTTKEVWDTLESTRTKVFNKLPGY